MMNIDSLTQKFAEIVASHELGEGKYARWIWQNKAGDRDLGNNEYGCADAMNILYTIGQFPTGEKREACLKALLDLQNRVTGLFHERTHHHIHTTAHCVAALELFDAKPRKPITGLKQYQTIEGMQALLEGLRWKTDPWRDSHEGAGVYAASVLCGEVDLAWQQAYFKWLWDHTDPDYGMSYAGRIDSGTAPLCHHMAGWFHYSFNTEYAHQPMRYPDKLIDSCLKLRETELAGTKMGRSVGFMEVDWIFCTTRAMRKTAHRRDEAMQAVLDFGRDYVAWLDSLDHKTHDGLNDLHCLFGASCAVAELQRALPGEFESTVPWKLVLDRRPFI